MILKTVNYREYYKVNDQNYWELSDLTLQKLNLIVGRNATGKTRVANLLNGLAEIISSKGRISNGEFMIEFIKSNNEILKYELLQENGKIVMEKITVGTEVVLDRNKKSTFIVSKAGLKSKKIAIEPPEDKLVLHIRRDVKEYPYFEDLINWASDTVYYKFSKFDPTFIAITDNANILKSLDTLPSVFEKLSAESIRKVFKSFNEMGYELENVNVGVAEGNPINPKILYIKEKGVKFPIMQPLISNGMLRAFALLVNVYHFIETQKKGLILVDDLGEGLDYERSTKLAKILFDTLNKSEIQLVSTTNDRFLMNAIDIDFWNILVRNGNKVVAKNIKNSKEIFEKFKSTGLSNFDLFSSNFLVKEQ